ncbi:hypothetical protein ACI77M_12940 [Pseudomonas fildesensis]|uniref:hypothetical protein n=1 Tax=Pseudomonas fildesensis TaxID=1674920 RepID=UPI00387B81C5
MTSPEPKTSKALRYLSLGVLCIAGVLGFFFVQFNAKVDRLREESAEHLVLCRQVERVASAASSRSVELSDPCKQLNEQSSKSVTPL